ncbi:MAG: pectinesterase family protein [Nibricoccus sp.]
MKAPSILVLVAMAWFAMGANSSLAAPDAVVALDGSGQYKSVQEAISTAPQQLEPGKFWTILVKPGTYGEVVYVQRERGHIRLIGEDPETTKITASLAAKTLGPDGKPIGTFRTATVYIDADDFIVENITLENAAGPVGQALAVRVDGDRVAFRNCRFLGWQDTILVNRGRHYFKNCFVAGATDFIFGGGNSFFEDCTIRCDGNGYVTAASTPKDQPFGLIFNRCTIVGSKPEVKTYLGRPWREFAMTVFLNCEMSDVVRPEGWHNWGKPEKEKTTRYAEYGSTGTGGDLAKRVPWARQLSKEEAASLTVERVLAGGDNWRPSSAQP